MLSIPALLLADLQEDATRIAFIWTIEKANGDLIRGTNHDADIEIPLTGSSPIDKYAGLYKAIANVTYGDIENSSDLSVDNLEVSGAFPSKSDDSPQYATVIDVDAPDIGSGMLDMAPVTVMICNWQAPAHGYAILKGGTLGQITRDSDGKYVTEVRGLKQQLVQIIIRTFSQTCNVVRFGQGRCHATVVTLTGAVAAPTDDRQEFEVSLSDSSPPAAASFVAGKLQFTSGLNAGFFREVKIDPRENAGVVQLWEKFPFPISDGDEFELEAGCARTEAACKFYGRFTTDFRGYGLHIPGVLALTSGPTTPAELGQ